MMVQGFISIVKLALDNESRHCGKSLFTIEGTNGQNDHPTYQAAQATQNSIIFGQMSINKKSNTGCTQNNSFSDFPKYQPFVGGGGGDNNELPTPQTFSLLT